MPVERRRLRLVHFNSWADRLEDAATFVQRAPAIDLRNRVADPSQAALLTKARLDCDWHAENSRVFAALSHPDLEFLPALVTGAPGLVELIALPTSSNEEHWLIFEGHVPQKIAGVLPQLLPFLARQGWRLFLYGFDEVSREMPCFATLAPHLSILIHDESPLDEQKRRLLSSSCLTLHRSWVANLLPYAAPFNENPEPKVLFLGSQLGLTENRSNQISFLQKKFGDRFIASHDHTVAVADRLLLNRYQVSICPEGRKFTTPAMSATHTDRPFWSGCLGMVPVSENSRAGNRLESLHREGLVVRYDQGDLSSLAEACEQALAMTSAQRRRIYDHFNRNETVGTVVTETLRNYPRGKYLN